MKAKKKHYDWITCDCAYICAAGTSMLPPVYEARDSNRHMPDLRSNWHCWAIGRLANAAHKGPTSCIGIKHKLLARRPRYVGVE